MIRSMDEQIKAVKFWGSALDDLRTVKELDQ